MTPPMQYTLLILLAGSFPLAVGLLILRLVRGSTAARRHLALVSALVTSVALMVLTGLAIPPTSPSTTQAVTPTFNGPGKFFDLPTEATAPDGPSLSPAFTGIVLGIWLTGSLSLGLMLAVRHSRMIGLIRRARPADEHVVGLLDEVAEEIGIGSAPPILTSSEVRIPLMWGPPWTFIVLPSSLPGLTRSELKMILLHEMAHRVRWDAAVQLATDLLCSLLWFQPLLWMVRSRLLAEQESASDDVVLSASGRPADYGQLLVDVARHALEPSRPRFAQAAALSMADRSFLESRLRRILDPATDHSGLRFRGAATAAAPFAVMVLLAATMATTAPGSTAEDSSPLLEDTARLDSFLDPIFREQMERHEVIGASLAVVQGDRLVFSKGYGKPSLDSAQPVDPGRTIFRIGSISKVVTAVATLQMVDRGAMSLDDDVNDHLEAFQVEEKFDEPVRVWHLLTHTAGFDQLGLDRHVMSVDEEVRMSKWLAGNLVRVRPPGQVSCYDTYGVTLAGHLVENASGQRFEEYLEQAIFEPLEMSRSSIYVRPEHRDDIATGYEGSEPPRASFWEYMNTNPASTVNSTAEDMANFMIMLLNDGKFRGRTVLGEELARAMKTRQFSNHPDLPGYGYLIYEDRDYGVEAVSHGGSMTGFAAFMYLVPEKKLGLFIALNRENGRFLGGIMESLMARLLEDAAVPPLREKAGVLDPSEYTGVYASNVHNHSRPEAGGWARRPFVLEADGDKLILGGAPAERVGADLFRRHDGSLAAFRRNAAGEIGYLFVRQEAYERLDLTVEDLLGPRMAEADLNRYAGAYEIETLGMRLQISEKNGYLMSSLPGEQARRLFSLGDHSFKDGEAIRVTFRMENGRAVGFDALAQGQELVGKRIGD